MAKKFSLHIHAATIEDVENAATELLYVMTGLREAQKKWAQHYGANNLKAKKYWQDKADLLIEKYKIKSDE